MSNSKYFLVTNNTKVNLVLHILCAGGIIVEHIPRNAIIESNVLHINFKNSMTFSG